MSAVITNELRWRDAIKAGVAEYIVDPKTGETTFQFKQTKP